MNVFVKRRSAITVILTAFKSILFKNARERNHFIIFKTKIRFTRARWHVALY